MTSSAKSTPYCIYVTSRPSPPYEHRRVNQRSRVLTYSLALPTWPAHAWEIVWKLTSHAPQTRKSPVLLESLWTCRFCRGKGGKRGKRAALPILAPSLYLRRRLPKLLRLFFFRLSVCLPLLSRRNPWNRVTFVRNQAVVSTQGPKLLRDRIHSLCLSFISHRYPLVVKSNSSWRINSCRGWSWIVTVSRWLSRNLNNPAEERVSPGTW